MYQGSVPPGKVFRHEHQLETGKFYQIVRSTPDDDSPKPIGGLKVIEKANDCMSVRMSRSSHTTTRIPLYSTPSDEFFFYEITEEEFLLLCL